MLAGAMCKQALLVLLNPVRGKALTAVLMFCNLLSSMQSMLAAGSELGGGDGDRDGATVRVAIEVAIAVAAIGMCGFNGTPMLKREGANELFVGVYLMGGGGPRGGRAD